MNNIVGIQSGHDVSYSILKNGMPLIHSKKLPKIHKRIRNFSLWEILALEIEKDGLNAMISIQSH
jgi:hypothetical protein